MMDDKGFTFYDWFSERPRTRLGLKRRARIEEFKFQRLKKYIPSGALMLEIGPGEGRFAELCRREGIRYFCIEPSPPLQKRLNEEGYPTIGGFVPPIAVKSQSIDVLYADQLLEHMPDFNAAAHFIAESRRVLKNDGHLVLIFPNYLKEKEFFFDIDYSHNFITTERRVEQMLFDCRFTPVDKVFSIGCTTGILRYLIKATTFFLGWGITAHIFRIFKAGDFLSRLRKNLFETIMVIARKEQGR
ncbi:hypothetical protein CEE39_08715 [bacterium (candidate division B38) B3_B38]|nr:MAG: hypothetical protein CEE39_08715 [bacterium (candidate division B38) B3_B38]